MSYSGPKNEDYNAIVSVVSIVLTLILILVTYILFFTKKLPPSRLRKVSFRVLKKAPRKLISNWRIFLKGILGFFGLFILYLLIGFLPLLTLPGYLRNHFGEIDESKVNWFDHYNPFNPELIIYSIEEDSEARISKIKLERDYFFFWDIVSEHSISIYLPETAYKDEKNYLAKRNLNALYDAYTNERIHEYILNGHDLTPWEYLNVLPNYYDRERGGWMLNEYYDNFSNPPVYIDYKEDILNQIENLDWLDKYGSSLDEIAEVDDTTRCNIECYYLYDIVNTAKYEEDLTMKNMCPSCSRKNLENILLEKFKYGNHIYSDVIYKEINRIGRIGEHSDYYYLLEKTTKRNGYSGDYFIYNIYIFYSYDSGSYELQEVIPVYLSDEK
ncbi:MAG TPA: hypothetical protein VGA67_01550 [Candidatus Dojkabacteria bacterium]|jgi:hypothetical protein